jgi:hypothetical protein
VRRWIKVSVLDLGVNFKVNVNLTTLKLIERVPPTEWKVEKDKTTDTHRHLSHLIGLYPGYALTSYDASLQGGLLVNGTYVNYTQGQVLDAAEISLIHRGNGTGPDGDTGWEKAWRAACWAQLGNATEFYHMLSASVHSLHYRFFGANKHSSVEISMRL